MEIFAQATATEIERGVTRMVTLPTCRHIKVIGRSIKGVGWSICRSIRSGGRSIGRGIGRSRANFGAANFAVLKNRAIFVM